MNQVLAEYISICSQFRKDGLSKPERKQRHAMLSEWATNIHTAEIPTLAELCKFQDCYGELCYNNYFIKSIIMPVVAADFENNGIDGIKFLFSCFRGHDRLYNNANSPLSIFCDYIGYKYDSLQLADKVLDVEPENIDVVNFKYYTLKSYLEFSLHEMPSGILDGMNGASVSAIPDMFHIVDEFQCLSERLSLKDDSTLIADCRKFYSAYENYLKNLDSFKNFADYMNRNGIEYKVYSNTYYYE